MFVCDAVSDIPGVKSSYKTFICFKYFITFQNQNLNLQHLQKLIFIYSSEKQHYLLCLVLVKLFCFTCVLFSYILFMQIFPLVKPAFIFFFLCGRVAIPVINELCCKCLLFSTNTEVYQRCIQRDRSVLIFPVCLLHIVVSNLFLSLCIGNNQHPVHRASHLFDFKNTLHMPLLHCILTSHAEL